MQILSKSALAAIVAVCATVGLAWGDFVAATVAVGNSPNLIALDSVTNTIYTVNGDDNSVTVINGSTNATTTVFVGSNPTAIAVNPVTNMIYAANNENYNVTSINGSTNGTTTISVGSEPSAIAVNPMTDMIFVANNGDNSVTIISGSTNATTTVGVGADPVAIAVNPVTNMIYSANNGGNSVTTINGLTNAATSISVGLSPSAIAVNPVTNTIYTANSGSSSITIINGLTHATSTVGVESNPQAIAVNPVTNMIYVANGGSNTVTVINGATNAAFTIPVGADPCAIAVNSLTNKIYVANYNNHNVTIIDGVTNTPATIMAGYSPVSIAVNSITNKIYIANNEGNSVTVFDGSSLPPGAPTLPTPSIGSSNLFLLITFSVQDDTSSVTSFTMEFSPTANFSKAADIIINDPSTVVNGPSITINDSLALVYGLNTNSTYFWHARATNQYGTSTWCAISSFSTAWVPDTLLAPGIALYWNNDTSTSVQMNLADNSNCETGYIIYRDSGFSGQFNQIGSITSNVPAEHNSLVFFDSMVSPNCWYRYKAAAYMRDSSVYSAICTTYTFRSQKPNQIAYFTKLSNYPISDSGGWSALVGDSVILKETFSPPGQFAVIDMRNPAFPAPAGYLDSAVLISYPLASLIPAYLKFGVANGYGPAGTKIMYIGGKILVAQDSIIRMYQASGRRLLQVDSVRADTAPYIPYQTVSGLLMLNDSLLVVSESTNKLEDHYYYFNCFPLLVSASSHIKKNTVALGSDYEHPGSTDIAIPWIRGLVNSKLEIPVTSLNYTGSYLMYSGQNVIFYDLDQGSAPYSIPIEYSTNFLSFNGNTGYYLTPAEFLSLNDTALWAEYIPDLNGYKTALSCNAVLHDTFSNVQNVLLDTVNKRVFIVCQHNLSSYSYTFGAAGVKNADARHLKLPADLRILSSSGQSGVTIVFPETARHADLTFFDLSGRSVDRLTATSSNAVMWRPKTHRSGCYTVSAKIDGEKYSARFMVR
jgi:YVTN family beta-propeller protein